jgi:hypothetical protein
MSVKAKADNFVSRGFCFTIHNCTDEVAKDLKAIPCLRCSAGYEECPETGTKHIQGPIAFDKPMRREAFKKAIGYGCCSVKMGGSWIQQAYCIKDGGVVRMTGEPPKQGARNDIVEFKGAAKRGATEAELCDDHTTCMAKYPGITGLYHNVQPFGQGRQSH